MGLDAMRNATWHMIIAIVGIMLMSVPALALELREGSVIKCRKNLHLYIGRVTSFTDDLVAIHVQMFDGGTPFAAHLPFAPEAFNRCTTSELPRSAKFDLEGFQGGFNEWKSAEGGIFTMPPREVRKMILGITGG